MNVDEYGIEGMAAEDRAYAGSRFQEVRDAVFAAPYPGIWDADGRMPTYEVTLKSVLAGIFPGGRPFHFRDATARTVDSRADLRWGPDRKGFRRLLHPNGICLTGTWDITAPAAGPSRWPATRPAAASPDAATPAPWRWSANCIRRRIRSIRPRSGRRISSRKRTSAATSPRTSTTPAC